MKNYIYFILILFVSCSDSKWNIELGHGYKYLNYGGAMDVDTYTGNAITYNSLFEDPIIFPEIVDYKFNRNFIVCKQVYDKKLIVELLQSSFESKFHEIFYQNNKVEYVGIKNYIKEYKDIDLLYNRLSKLKNKNHIGFTKSVTDSILKTNILFLKMERQKENFYIIDKKYNKNYLVLNKNVFSKLFIDLKIPDSLKIH